MVSNHKPVLIVIAGPNGSGKTTVTEQILRHEWMGDAIYTITQSKIGMLAHSLGQSMARWPSIMRILYHRGQT